MKKNYIIVTSDIVRGNDIKIVCNHMTQKYENAEIFFLKSRTITDHSSAPANLSNLNLDSKLIIIGHGTENAFKDGITGYSPAGLAQLLKRHSLHQVGLVTFKSCNIGKGNYLLNLLSFLSSLEIEVGWLKGYIDDVALRTPRQMPPRQEERLNEPQRFMLKKEVPWLPKLSDFERVKIIRGNTAISLPLEISIRYS